MSNSTDQSFIQQQFEVMKAALAEITKYGDCNHESIDKCPMCIARQALAKEGDWRYVGHNSDRLKSNPREAAIIQSWKRYMTGIATGTPDYKLSLIIGKEPTAANWLVATSVVQWIATSVGENMLFDAGYHCSYRI